MKGKHCLLTLLMLVLLCALIPLHALAETPLLPDVTQEMTVPAFWTEELEDADAVLADLEQIHLLNQSFAETPACRMIDLARAEEEFDERLFYRDLWQSAFESAAGWMRAPYYDSEGEELTGPELNARLENIGGDFAAERARVRYGICVRRADLLALPGAELMTDELGDLDFDCNQLSSVRVNEPVIVKAESRDGAYYYCDTDCVSGWVAAEDIALCADREEWLSAWSFPDEEAIVVTEGKLYLENSNCSPDSSEVLLTMGTVLHRVADEEYDAMAVNRAPFHNYAVWLPVRLEDGSYGRTIALIPQNRSVSEGCLPLTSENITALACSRLGDVYGWGGMLNSVDCSNFVRDVYRCFGLTLPRNTTTQSKMPVCKYDVSEADEREKEELLDMLPPGAVLYFSGHEMLYLGKANGAYYVISAVSSIRDLEQEDEAGLRVRSIVISSLDTQRVNGETWLEALNLMLLPYVPEEPAQMEPFETETDAEIPALDEEKDVMAEEAAPPETKDPEQPDLKAEEAPEAEKTEVPEAEPAPENGAPEATAAGSVPEPDREPDAGTVLTLPGGQAANSHMQLAIEQALYGIGQQHGGPFGCVIVRDDEVVGRGHDRSAITDGPDGHCVMEALRDAEQKLGTGDLSGCILYTTGEPCPDCLLACMAASIDRVRYGCNSEDNEDIGFSSDSGTEVPKSIFDRLFCTDRSACLRLYSLYSELIEAA